MGHQEHTSFFLDGLIQDFVAAGADPVRMNAKDLEIITHICNASDHIIWINSHIRIEPILINNAGRAYYGFTNNDLRGSGFELYKKFLDPEHFENVHKTVQYFMHNPNEVFKMTYRIRKGNGDWCWTYSLAKAMGYTEDGKPTNVLAVVYDIEELLVNGSGMHTVEFQRYSELYDKLTDREKQVLHFIANEHTSHEIADLLDIKATTIDTHRKRIIKKLRVRNSLGLVKFALMFDEEK